MTISPATLTLRLLRLGRDLALIETTKPTEGREDCEAGEVLRRPTCQRFHSCYGNIDVRSRSLNCVQRGHREIHEI